VSNTSITYKIKDLASDSFLETKDAQIVSVQETFSNFDNTVDKLELHIYSLQEQLLISQYNHLNFKTVSSEILELLPEEDINLYGLETADVKLVYNFHKNLVFDKLSRNYLFISEVSPDRTEIKCSFVNDISEESIQSIVRDITNTLEGDSEYYNQVVLNFGLNNLQEIVNVNTFEEGSNFFIIFKLYIPLNISTDIKDRFSVEQVISTPTSLEITAEYEFTRPTYTALRGPNFNINVENEYSYPGDFLSKLDIENLITPNSRLSKILSDTQARISIDHSDYQEFIHFSSAEERLRNFKYKLDLINSSTDSVKKGIISTFDHYDEYLYYRTGSASWPKDSSNEYLPYSSSNAQAISFFNIQISKASLFDENNPHRLVNTIPSFLREDSNNEPYNMFIDMIGQHFDNLWLYTKNITKKYDADNRLDYGVSKDLIADTLRNFGIKLYSSKVNIETVFNLLIGNNELYNTPPVGQTFITGSNPTPLDNYQKEIYKRLYHNLPLLLKAKGTERGLRALINCFGIPSEYLPIRYYGGVNTDSDLFLGHQFSTTSSLDKIRLDNTGSISVNPDRTNPGNTLSYYTNIVKNDDKYTQDLNIIDVGFSPTDNLNQYLIQESIPSDFNIDEYIGSPTQIYESSYSDLRTFAESTFSSSIDSKYSLYDFVRQVSFYDNTLFKMIQDFVPAKANVSTGIIIKPHILERSKVKQPRPSWLKLFETTQASSSLDFTGSEYSKNFTLDGEIGLIEVDGGYGFESQGSNYSSQFNEQLLLPSGEIKTLVRREGFYDGELSGSILRATTGELNVENIFKNQRTESDNFILSEYEALYNNVEINVNELEYYHQLLSWSTPRYLGSKNSANIITLPSFEQIEIDYPAVTLSEFKGYNYLRNSVSETKLSQSLSEGIDKLGNPETLYFHNPIQLIQRISVESTIPFTINNLGLSSSSNINPGGGDCVTTTSQITGSYSTPLTEDTTLNFSLRDVVSDQSIYIEVTGSSGDASFTSSYFTSYKQTYSDPPNKGDTGSCIDNFNYIIEGYGIDGVFFPPAGSTPIKQVDNVGAGITLIYKNESSNNKDVAVVPNSLIIDSSTRIIYKTDRYGKVVDIINK